MTIRTIKYMPKITNARTQYCDIDSKDMALIQMEMIRYLSVMGEMSINRNEDVRSVLKLGGQNDLRRYQKEALDKTHPCHLYRAS